MRFFLSVAFATLLFFSSWSQSADSLRAELKIATGGKKAKLEFELAQTIKESDAPRAFAMAQQAEASAIRSQEKHIEIDAILLQAEIHSDLQKYPEAQVLLDNAVAMSEKYQLQAPLSHAYNASAKIFLRTGELDKALQLFKLSLAIREKLNLCAYTSSSQNNIGLVYREMGDIDSARLAFQESYRTAEGCNDFVLQANALNNMAGVYWKEGDFSNAISLYEQSLQLREKTGDLIQIAKSLNNIGIVYKDLSDYEHSLKYHMQALKLKEEIGVENDIAYSLNNIGSVYLKLGRPDSATFYYEKALAIREISGDITEQANSHNNIALAYKEAKQYSLAIKHFEISQRLKEEIGNQAAISNTANLLGNLYLEKLEFDKALEQYYIALKIRKGLGRSDLEAQSLNNIGLLFKSLKNYSKALKYFEESLQLYEALSNSILTAYQHNIIGGTYWEMKDFGKALHHYGISLELRKSIGDKRYIASSLKNIGMVHKEAGNSEKAIETYTSAMTIYESIGDSVGYAWAITYLGNAYKDVRRYQDAMNAYQRALTYFTKLNTLSGEAAVHYNLGEFYIERNQLLAGLSSLKQATSIANRNGNKELVLKASELLADNYAKIGNHALAYKYLAMFSAVQDSIANTEVMKRFADIQIEHELDRKNAEIDKIEHEQAIEMLHQQKSNSILLGILIALAVGIVAGAAVYYQKISNTKKLEALNRDLQKKNDDLKRSEANLAHANMTKTKFFSIIAHDLKNPFSSFIGLTDMLLDHFDVMSEEKKKKFIKNLNSSANKTYFLLENLLDWSRTETTHIRLRPEDFQLNSIVDDVLALQKTAALNGNIFLTTQIDDSIMIRGDRNMLTTVMRNLISNAIKFTPEDGTVSIKSTIAGDEVFVHIEDSGSGISEEDLKKLFNKQVDFREIGKQSDLKGAGLGLSLCKEFIDKHKGKIWVESKEGKGSTFSFSVNKAVAQN